MRLADDDRGRVPFALIGVLLLVGSAAFSAGLASRPMDRSNPAVDRAFDRATASMHTALTTAVRTAGRDAASAPVTRRADTPYGRVLNESTPFRDALRIRIYLAARRGLVGVEGRSGPVRVRASLPPVTNASTFRRAKRRVHLSRVAGDGEVSTRVRVRMEGIEMSARRDGRAVERETRSSTVVVSTPVLALHDRVSAYEKRLNRGPLDGGPGVGLGARLTARLYPVAWARGYAQYGGAPIENVVANRHVAFAANGGVLGVQRDVFGRSDPAGRRAVSRAGREVAMADLKAGFGVPGSAWTDLLLAPAGDDAGDTAYPGRTRRDGPAPNGTITVGVNRTADVAFRGFVLGGNGESIASVADSVYEAGARLDVRTRPVREEARPESRPGPAWTRANGSTRVDEDVETVPANAPATAADEDVLESYGRRITRLHVAVEWWTRGNETRRTVTTWTDEYRVDLAVVGEPAATRDAPSRPVRTIFERGGPLDGPNLRGVPNAAEARLVARQGGADALARRAVSGRVGMRRVTVDGRRPPGLETWLYGDLADLREHVRNVSVEVRRDAAGRANPAARLADALRARRGTLVGAPVEYGSVAGKARVAARGAYLDRVLADLDARAGRNREIRGKLNDAMADAGMGSLSRLGRIADARKRADRPTRRGLSADGPIGGLRVEVDGEPSYLTLSEVSHEHTSAVSRPYRPLAARNVNLFTTPYGDVADTVVGKVMGGEGTTRVDLRTAALVLGSANRTLVHTDDPALADRRDALDDDVGKSLSAVKADVRDDLRAEPFGLDAGERRAAVAAGFARWDTAEARALAAGNGSAARAVAAEIRQRSRLVRGNDRTRDWMRTRVRLSMGDAVADAAVRVPQESVNRTATRTRRVSRRVATKAIGDRVANASERARTRWFEETLGAIPSGLPVAPVPGYWYATMNVWHVTVRGQYATFTVRAKVGTPASPGATVQYTRSAGTVSLDVDGDGAAERLGRTEPIRFETSTVVLVVVPPNGKGVGDTDGNADERSTGW